MLSRTLTRPFSLQFLSRTAFRAVSTQNVPTPSEIRQAAAAGKPISREDVSNITHQETAYTGQTGPVPGGPAATAQSLYTKQQAFANKAEELLRKAPQEITQNDAREIQSKEVGTITLLVNELKEYGC
jgi:Seed maturation protein